MQQALQFLDDPKRYGSDTDPSLLRAALKRLGSPESGFTVVHLAGTNGKGSTGAYLCSLLGAHGERAGHFTSPHVSDFLERIRIDGENCDPDLFTAAASFVQTSLEGMDGYEQLRAFSLQLFCALVAFRTAGVRFAVIEAGIGGRDDATNILIPRVSVLTPIGMDHMQRLGSSVTEIARHKAGIIKPGVPVFSAVQTVDASRVIEQTAHVNSAPLHFLNRESISVERSDPFGVEFLWDGTLLLQTSMGGRYQAENAALAILVARHLIPDLSAGELKEGIRHASMPGRRQLVSESPRIVVDGAHNQHAIEAFCEENRNMTGTTGIIGMMDDKEAQEVLGLWRSCFDTLYLVPVADERSWDPVRVKNCFFSDDPHTRAFDSLQDALAAEKASGTETVYIMGSLYLAGEALALFQKP